MGTIRLHSTSVWRGSIKGSNRLWHRTSSPLQQSVHGILKRVLCISAKNPLGTAEHESWWKRADDPWQCLSTCMELTNALESPDPLQYECPLPVHQDGTCNGLQHYAALGGDAQGARQVNLDVAERPSDVYTYVANMVEKRIEEDLKSTDARTRRYAELLHGRIARKVVKQTVRLFAPYMRDDTCTDAGL